MYKNLFVKFIAGMLVVVSFLPQAASAQNENLDLILEKQQAFAQKWSEVLSIRGDQDYKTLTESTKTFESMRASEKELKVLAQELAEMRETLKTKDPSIWNENEKKAMAEMDKNVIIYDHYENMPEETRYQNEKKLTNNIKYEQKYTDLMNELKDARIKESIAMKEYVDLKTAESGKTAVNETSKLKTNSLLYEYKKKETVTELQKAEKAYLDANRASGKLQVSITSYHTPKDIFDPLTLDKLQKTSTSFLTHFENPAYKPQLTQMVDGMENFKGKSDSVGRLLGAKVSSYTRHEAITVQRKNSKSLFKNRVLSSTVQRNNTRNAIHTGAKVVAGGSAAALLVTLGAVIANSNK